MNPNVSWVLPYGEGELWTMCFMEEQHVRWIFRHTYRQREQRRVRILNKLTVTVDWENNVASKLEVSMHVIIPERLGRRVWLGIDISPGAKTFLTFEYERGPSLFRLSRIGRGASTWFDVPDEPGLTQQIDFPFPIRDRVLGPNDYAVPYRANDESEASFVFPNSIAHTQRFG